MNNPTAAARRVVKPNTLDEISVGDRIQFFHGPTGRDQWATVVNWEPAGTWPGGKIASWDAVLDVADMGLGNGFSAGRQVIDWVIERYSSGAVRFAYTPGVYLP